jgi:predicted adenine nucleotide alpha hydrolase (AANH) superfamily ATPase
LACGVAYCGKIFTHLNFIEAELCRDGRRGNDLCAGIPRGAERLQIIGMRCSACFDMDMGVCFSMANLRKTISIL